MLCVNYNLKVDFREEILMREVNLYNTLSKKIEPFHPNEEGKVKMYTCGPTVSEICAVTLWRMFLKNILGTQVMMLSVL